MRRSSAILFMFLAITVILAHSFIPHEHHEDHICLVNKPCHHSCGQEDELNGPRPEQYPGSYSDHHHDNKGQCESCHAGTGHQPHGHGEQRHGEQRHGEQRHGEQGECRLASILVYSPHSHKSDETCSYCYSDTDHENFPPAITANNRAQNGVDASNLPFRQKPYIDLPGKPGTLHTGSSRAPPLS